MVSRKAVGLKKVLLKRCFSYLVKYLIAKPLFAITGRGGGLGRILPKGQHYVLKNYAGRYNLDIDTQYFIECYAWLFGVWDVETTRFLESTLNPGDVFLDIGANCGVMSLVAAAQKARVYAFEPGPEIYPRLQSNVDNNRLQDVVTVISMGLGNTQGRLNYEANDHIPGNGILGGDSGPSVEVTTLDQWISTHPLERIDLIKMDVEGMETQVLEGAMDTLRRFRPIVHLETLWIQDGEISADPILRILDQCGYALWSAEPPYQKMTADSAYPENCLAIPRDSSFRWPRES